MKLLKAMLWVVPALALISAVISMFYLPETIPIQIDISGNYSNFGSKYMLFIFPIITLIFPASSRNPNGRFSKTPPWLLLILELIILGVEIFAISTGLNYK